MRLARFRRSPANLPGPLADIFNVDMHSEQQNQATATAERRRSARESRMAPAWLSEASGGGVKKTQQQVTVVDLSLHGVGFIAPRQLEPDATHWIVVATGTLHLSTRLRVVNCRPREDGHWIVGAEFY